MEKRNGRMTLLRSSEPRRGIQDGIESWEALYPRFGFNEVIGQDLCD